MQSLIRPIMTLLLLAFFCWNLLATRYAIAGAALTHVTRHLIAHDLALHGTTGHEVHDDKHSKRDAEEYWNNQEKAPNEIAGHGLLGCASSSFWAWPNRSCQ